MEAPAPIPAGSPWPFGVQWVEEGDAFNFSLYSRHATAVTLLCYTEEDPAAPVFPDRAGMPLSRSGVRQRIQHTVTLASQRCPSLRTRRISPHVFRHTTAMHLLQSGVDLTVIALWLGHEDPSTTHRYLEADLAMKEAALRQVQEPEVRPGRFHASNRLLAFLKTL